MFPQDPLSGAPGFLVPPGPGAALAATPLLAHLNPGQLAALPPQTEAAAPPLMRPTGFADTRPLAPNDTPQGRAQNRHVEVILEAPK